MRIKPRHAAALALVGWYLIFVPTTTNAQASPTSTPSEQAEHVWKGRPRAKAAIAANAWVLKVRHVKYMRPTLVRPPDSPTPFWAIGIFVDKSENVREVEGKVPTQLDGVGDFVDVSPVVVWCLSVSLGKDVAKKCSRCLEGKEVAKDCSGCAVTLELEAHSCEKEFKTKARCESGAAKYVRDWYVDADKNGDVVAEAPTAHCWEAINPTNSHWDPITEKAVPDNQ
jgi:hypothetical protein